MLHIICMLDIREFWDLVALTSLECELTSTSKPGKSCLAWGDLCNHIFLKWPSNGKKHLCCSKDPEPPLLTCTTRIATGAGPNFIIISWAIAAQFCMLQCCEALKLWLARPVRTKSRAEDCYHPLHHPRNDWPITAQSFIHEAPGVCREKCESSLCQFPANSTKLWNSFQLGWVFSPWE